jgi:hypothetical protein
VRMVFAIKRYQECVLMFVYLESRPFYVLREVLLLLLLLPHSSSASSEGFIGRRGRVVKVPSDLKRVRHDYKFEGNFVLTTGT